MCIYVDGIRYGAGNLWIGLGMNGRRHPPASLSRNYRNTDSYRLDRTGVPGYLDAKNGASTLI